MIALSVRFIAGRYHATPWGHHVNEGLIEWPPSPWRILRALLASCKRACREVASDAEMDDLLSKLAAPPSYVLPACGQGHTRHYMPWDKNWKPFSDSAKAFVFDSFLTLSPEEPLYIVWHDEELTEEEIHIMQKLTRGVSYLGRAESWCEMELVGSVPREANCLPMEDGAGSRKDPIRLLSPELPLRASCLLASTSDLRREGFMLPPGTRWVSYESLESGMSTPAARKRKPRRRPDTAYYQLAGSVMPHAKEAMPVAEIVRLAAQSRYGRACEGASSPTLSGKDENGKMLSGHRHAFFLPLDENGDGRLDHFLIWAPEGFSEPEVEAVAGLREINRGNTAFQMTLLFLGASASCPSPVLASSERWVSATPFVLTRHPKKNRDTPADQVLLELERRGFPAPKSIEPHQARVNGRRMSWLDFKRFRSHRPATGHAYGFRLVFEEPVRGPMALGYSCHFGLGQFVPER